MAVFFFFFFFLSVGGFAAPLFFLFALPLPRPALSPAITSALTLVRPTHLRRTRHLDPPPTHTAPCQAANLWFCALSALALSAIAAVTQNGRVLEYVDKELQDDIDR